MFVDESNLPQHALDSPVGAVDAHHALGRVDSQLPNVLIHARRTHRSVLGRRRRRGEGHQR
eukprot:9365541-Pyramimonas_sp.AAC.1